MADNKATQASAEELVAVAEQSTVAAKENRHILPWLLVFALFVILAVSQWFIYQQQTRQQQRLAQLTSQLATTGQLTQQLTQLTTTLATETAARQQQFAELSDVDAKLTLQIKELAAEQPLTDNAINQKLILAEIEWLLKMANQQTLLAGDVDAALTALSLADQQLLGLADPRFYQLRKMIAAEKLALAAVQNVDISGLAAKLHSAIAVIDSLQVLPVTATTQQAATADSEPEMGVSANWQIALADAWQQLRSLVVIRHRQDGSAALLVPEQRYFLYQNLRLTLASARFALLANNEQLFASNLLTAQQWLQQYFVGNERDALLAVINEMLMTPISVALPDISGSLRWLKQQGEQ